MDRAAKAQLPNSTNKKTTSVSIIRFAELSTAVRQRETQFETLVVWKGSRFFFRLEKKKKAVARAACRVITRS